MEQISKVDYTIAHETLVWMIGQLREGGLNRDRSDLSDGELEARAAQGAPFKMQFEGDNYLLSLGIAEQSGVEGMEAFCRIQPLSSTEVLGIHVGGGLEITRGSRVRSDWLVEADYDTRELRVSNPLARLIYGSDHLGLVPMAVPGLKRIAHLSFEQAENLLRVVACLFTKGRL